MTVYVDPVQSYPTRNITPAARKYGNRWCHLITDGDENELHDFAQLIGCSRSWFQEHRWWSHYDLTPSMRRKALQHGAIEVQSLVSLAMKIGKVGLSTEA